jgi:hypothetical protein
MKKDTPPDPNSETFLDLIRRVGDRATEEVRRDMAQPSASGTQSNSEENLNDTEGSLAAQSVLKRGLAKTLEEAQKMVDEAI